MNANRELDLVKKKFSDQLKKEFRTLPIKWSEFYSLEKSVRNKCLEEFKDKIGESFFDEFKADFDRYVFDADSNSGVFLQYIEKNSDLIKEFAEKNLKEIKEQYKQQMCISYQDNLSNWNTLKNTKNKIAKNLFSQFKSNLNGFTHNKNEVIADIDLFEMKFEQFRETKDEEIKKKYQLIQYFSDFDNSNISISTQESNESTRCSSSKKLSGIYTLVKNQISFFKLFCYLARRCKDGSLDMRYKENRERTKYKN